MEGGALFSQDHIYRWHLWRRWGADSVAALSVIMLNPSTADEEKDDPTIRRVIGFAKREGYGGVYIANLFALRATDPAELARHPDPIGLELNNQVMWGLASDTYGSPVLAAWGAEPFAEPRAREVVATFKGRRQLVCLGSTKSGAPKHPLYLRGDTPFQPFAPA